MGAGEGLSRRNPEYRTDGAPGRARPLVHQQLEPPARPQHHTANDDGNAAAEDGLLSYSSNIGPAEAIVCRTFLHNANCLGTRCLSSVINIITYFCYTAHTICYC